MSTEVYIYLFITAVIFTIVGFSNGVKKISDAQRKFVIASTIESLINDGYIATSKVDGKVEDILTIAEYDKTH